MALSNPGRGGNGAAEAATAIDTVTLKGGGVVSLAALRLLWSFEHRGCIVRQAEDGMLLVGPRDRITDAERVHIREHRDALLRLVTYCEAIQ
ncbi:MAG: hypothetical protein ABJC51_02235 [Acidobacteriota bacterium]